MLAGFAFTGIVEAPWDTIRLTAPKALTLVCVLSTVFGMVFELLAVIKTVQLAILGPGLALRGTCRTPDLRSGAWLLP